MSVQEMFACFYVGGIELAFSTKSLQEVVAYPEKVMPATLDKSYFIGVFNLRGSSLPLIDVASLLGIPDSDKSCEAKRIAIVKVGSHRLGLCLDSTSEILTVAEQDISSFDSPPTGSRSVIRRVLKLQGGDRLVEVFEPEVLAQLEDVAQILGRSVVIEDTSKVKKNGPRKQCITFHSEEYLFGLPMEGIREIIRVPQIQKSVLAVDYCLGMFNLRGMIIPIIDFKQFISGERSQNSDSQRVIVIRLEEIQIGLLVDKIGSIAPYYDEDIQTYTASSSKIQDMMNGIVSNEGAEHVLILRPDNILNDTEILAISRGHHSLYGGVSADPRKEHKKVTDRKMYLRFQLQYPLSTRLNNIEEIARPEENMMRPPGSPDYVVGLLKLRGEMLMVVDLRSYYGLGQINDFVNSRIIVTQGAKAKYGFLVDSVESIDTVDESQKIQLPVFLVRDIARNLHGDMSEVVEMKDMSGNKKAFMILDLPELVRKLELKTA